MGNLNIMHVDMDAFFAAVEQLDNPELCGKPVIVGGTALNNRGVVSTASYEARKFGVHSAMPLIQAKKLCPHGIYLSGRRKRYQQMSAKIFEIFSQFTPLIEKISIDEAFLDLTGCHKLFGSSRDIGQNIKKMIKEEAGLIASIGIAPNKFLAKLASDLEKPDGFVIIEEDKIAEILEPLSISKIWGIGDRTEEILTGKGIKTIGMLKKLSKQDLENLLGKYGKNLYFLARGIDNRTLSVKEKVKSISHERTFVQSLKDPDKIFSVLSDLSEKVSRRLRKKSLKAGTVFIKIRYDDFTTFTRRITFKQVFDDTEEIYKTGKKLLIDNNLLSKPLRLLGVGVSNLTSTDKQQLSLFQKGKYCQQKKAELTQTIDHIKDRFGEDSIQRAKNLIYKNYNPEEEIDDIKIKKGD